MFNSIEKWLSKFSPADRERSAQLIAAPREGLSRRGFLNGLTGGFIGISTGIIQPSRKILVAMPEAIPRLAVQNYFKFNIAKSILGPLARPLYDTEKIFCTERGLEFKHGPKLAFFKISEAKI